MARRVTQALIVIAVVVAVSVWVRGQSDGSSLQGAWMLQDVSYAKPPAFKVNKPSGMMIFSGSHYSVVTLMDSGARPEVGATGDAAKSMDDLRAAWGPLFAQAGTFQSAGDKLTLRASVSKANQPMASGSFTEYTVTIKGDSLVLVSGRNQAGPTANPETRRYTRAK